MAQRATKFAKKTSRHVEVGVLARASSDPIDDMRSVPLDVLPLLAPFKKRGRLTVRIEKLPIQARLSAGRNNGDRSYSLTVDELDDLSYLAPEGTEPRPVLSVRILALDDGDAATIAVRELPVDFGREDNGVDADDVRRLIDELTRVKSELAIRESELAEARMKSSNPRAEVTRQQMAEELAAARAAIKAEADERVAKVQAEAAAKLAQSWSAWQAEQEKKGSAGSDAAVAKERARWQQESAAVLAQAEKDWKTAETARFNAAEAKWREHSESAIEKARASSKSMREHGDAIELRRLRDELMAMQNLLAERDAELAQAQSGKKPQAPSRQEIEAAVAKAQKEWKEAEAARFAAAERLWQQRAEKALSEAQAQGKSGPGQSDAELRRLREELAATQSKLANREKELTQAQSSVKSGRDQIDTELRKLRDELSVAQAKLAGREKELAQAQATIKETQERGLKNADVALSKAEQIWKAREAEKLSAAEKHWQDVSANALAEANAQADALLSQARDRWASEAEVMLAKAESGWKAREAERLAAAEAQWQQKITTALAEARTQAQATRDQGDIELARLRAELTNAQRKLSERECALAEAKAAADRAREEGKAALAKAEQSWKSSEATRIAVVEKRMREQSGSALTEAEAARNEAEAELRQLREHSATLETHLADRELELTQAIARINAVQTEIEGLRENEDIQVRRVRGEVTSLEAKLAERDEELAQARLFAERSYERWQKQAEAELAKAQKAWKSAEASRLAAARAEWQEESRRLLQQSLEVERRSGRLPPARTSEDGVVSTDIVGSDDNRPLPVFEPPAQAAPYVAPKPQVSSARDAADKALDRLAMDAYQLLASPASLDAASPTDTRIIKGGLIDRRQKTQQDSKSLVVPAAIAAALAAAAALVFFLVWPMISPSAPEPAQQVATKAAPAPQPKVIPRPMATVTRSVNMRSGPSTSDTVITQLKVGDQLVAGERNGNWVQVELPAQGGKSAQQGWVFATSLKLAVAAPAADAAVATEEPASASAPATAEPAAEAPRQADPEPQPNAAPQPEPTAAASAPAQAPAPEPQASAPAPEPAGTADSAPAGQPAAGAPGQ